MNKTCFIRFIFLFMLIGSAAQAQLSVKYFRMLENDLDARVNFPVKDQNGDIAALIKVVTTQKGFTFDGGMTGIVKTIEKPSEIWVYVPWGIKRISIFHPQLGQLRDYMISMSVEKATVYELVLISGSVTTIVEETIESQWLVITPEPANASVYIDDVYINKGVYQSKLKPGSYNYRVEAPLYHPQIGVINITDKKEDLKVVLKPNFGYIRITSTPESAAQVLIDDKVLNSSTPVTSDMLKSGEYTVKVIKEMYQPFVKKVTVTDETTTEINAVLQPNFAELIVNAPSEASLYINNQLKGTGSWKGRLPAGVFSLEARLNRHRNARQDIELKTGENRIVNLNPSPIFGSLDVMTNPPGAKIMINGNDYGFTPSTINKLLIGDYEIEITKSGYSKVNKTISIEDSKVVSVNEILQNGKTVTITSNPSSAKLFIDQKEVGVTPFNGIVSYGVHHLRAVIDNYVDEKNITITEAKDDIYNLNLGKYITIDADIKKCKVYINDLSVGYTPYKGIIGLGHHKIKVIYEGYQFEKQVSIMQYESEINVSFDIKKSVSIEKMSGPENVFLSLLVPGLGDWNVTKREKNGIGKMLWSYGLILGGVGCKLYSNNEYKQYHLATEQAAIDAYYTNANYANYAFYGLVASGLVVWVYDIIWVAKRGTQNIKERDKNRLALIYEPNNQLVGLSYSIKF